MSLTVQRIAGALLLLLAGLLCLPAAATFLDGQGNENWIVVALLLVMAAVGAGVTVAMPALAREGASTRRRAVTGVWWGMLAAFAAVVVFFLLISGVGGA